VLAALKDLLDNDIIHQDPKYIALLFFFPESLDLSLLFTEFVYGGRLGTH
jgi:hypothetical protein